MFTAMQGQYLWQRTLLPKYQVVEYLPSTNLKDHYSTLSVAEWYQQKVSNDDYNHYTAIKVSTETDV